MGVFTITTSGYQNQPPTQVGDNTVNFEHGGTYVFTVDNFTTETSPPYTDPEGDNLSKIKITSIVPVNGSLKLSGVDVLVNDEITEAQISAGNLTWVDDGTNPLAHSSGFDFKISDVGSNVFSTSIGSMDVEVNNEVNLPPSSVGDRSETLSYGETLVFTRAMFTSLTTPPYSDDEGDPADKLKITSIPLVGQVKLNGVPVKENQIVNFSDIDLGYLTFSGDLKELDSSESTFSFEIADAGSGIFAG